MTNIETTITVLTIQNLFGTTDVENPTDTTEAIHGDDRFIQLSDMKVKDYQAQNNKEMQLAYMLQLNPGLSLSVKASLPFKTMLGRVLVELASGRRLEADTRTMVNSSILGFFDNLLAEGYIEPLYTATTHHVKGRYKHTDKLTKLIEDSLSRLATLNRAYGSRLSGGK